VLAIAIEEVLAGRGGADPRLVLLGVRRVDDDEDAVPGAAVDEDVVDAAPVGINWW
jgi:hypothetical protein